MNSKILLVFVGLCGLAIADNSDLFVGRWKEDQYKREGLNDYLYYRGLNWFKRVYVTNANFELTMNIAKEGNTFSVSGKKGPKNEDYAFELVPNASTRTDADLGALGGPRKAVAEFKGNSLVTSLHRIEDDIVDVLAIRTIDPANPNEMTYVLRDVESGSELKQFLTRQN